MTSKHTAEAERRPLADAPLRQNFSGVCRGQVKSLWPCLPLHIHSFTLVQRGVDRVKPQWQAWPMLPCTLLDTVSPALSCALAKGSVTSFSPRNGASTTGRCTLPQTPAPLECQSGRCRSWTFPCSVCSGLGVQTLLAAASHTPGLLCPLSPVTHFRSGSGDPFPDYVKSTLLFRSMEGSGEGS